jgi:hypothetical protein
MYGDPATSSGTLLSGQLFLNIKEDGLEIESLDATLSIHVTQKKPFANHCAECTNQYTELKKWELLQHPLAMAKGRARALLVFVCRGDRRLTMACRRTLVSILGAVGRAPPVKH